MTRGHGTGPIGRRSIRPTLCLVPGTRRTWATIQFTRPCYCLAGIAPAPCSVTLGFSRWLRDGPCPNIPRTARGNDSREDEKYEIEDSPENGSARYPRGYLRQPRGGAD